MHVCCCWPCPAVTIEAERTVPSWWHSRGAVRWLLLTSFSYWKWIPPEKQASLSWDWLLSVPAWRLFNEKGWDVLTGSGSQGLNKKSTRDYFKMLLSDGLNLFLPIFMLLSSWWMASFSTWVHVCVSPSVCAEVEQAIHWPVTEAGRSQSGCLGVSHQHWGQMILLESHLTDIIWCLADKHRQSWELCAMDCLERHEIRSHCPLGHLLDVYFGI